MFILKNAILVVLCVCVFLLVAFTLGCFQERSKYDNWYAKNHWKAEDYFDDPEVILLCKAMETEDLETIDRLIAAGVDVNAMGKKGMQPILWAYPAGEKVFEKILEAGGNPNFEGSDPDNYGAKRGCGFYGITLLHTATMDSSDEPAFKNYLAMLLRYGADSEVKHGNAIFYSLLTRSNDELIKQYIEAGINLNTDAGDGHYLVTTAARQRRYKALMILLEAGAEYRTDTLAGYNLHNLLFKRKTTAPIFKGEQEEYDECIAWLEERGVSFDKPAEKPDVFREVEEFRVNDKLLKWREKHGRESGQDDAGS